MKSKNKSTFVFKYDKKNNLINYIERSPKNEIIAYYSYNHKNNGMLKYDHVNKFRIFNQFESPCKLVQRFEGGESWIRAVAVTDNEYSLTYPKIKKQFALNQENQIVKFSVHLELLNQWK